MLTDEVHNSMDVVMIVANIQLPAHYFIFGGVYGFQAVLIVVIIKILA